MEREDLLPLIHQTVRERKRLQVITFSFFGATSEKNFQSSILFDSKEPIKFYKLLESFALVARITENRGSELVATFTRTSFNKVIYPSHSLDSISILEHNQSTLSVGGD